MRIIITFIFFLSSIPARSQFVDISDPNITISSEIRGLGTKYSASFKGIHYSLKSFKNGEPAVEFILWAEKDKKISVDVPEIILEFSSVKSITLIPYRDSSFYFNDGTLCFISIQLIKKSDITILKSEPIKDLILFGNQMEKMNLTGRSKKALREEIRSFFINYP